LKSMLGKRRIIATHCESTSMTIKLPNSRALGGLIKWLSREEWRSEFEQVLESHLIPACDAAGIEVDEAISALGEDWFRTTVWGCAFEDFLTRETDDGANIVDDYLKRRGWKESASAKSYMRALRNSVISLYEVSNIVPDTSFLARDLVRGGEASLISEQSATRTLKQWDRIATRVVALGSQTVISGAVLPYSFEASETLLKILRRTAKRAVKERHKLADSVGCGPDDPRIAGALSETVLLQIAAPIITTVWLGDNLDRSMNPRLPDVRNSEGDELMFCTLHFPVSEAASLHDVRSALGKSPELRKENETFWNWLALGTAQRKPNKGTHQTFSTTLDDGSLVLGTLELKDHELVLSVNSQARAERGRVLLSQTLESLIRPPLIEMQTLDQLQASRVTEPSPPRSVPELSPDQQRAIVHTSLNKQYGKMLSEPIPILGNVTPRKAAKTAAGRAKVAAWLKTLENYSAQLGDSDNPIGTYDFSWLWLELGVSELRH
jgi:hypothetical protein